MDANCYTYILLLTPTGTRFKVLCEIRIISKTNVSNSQPKISIKITKKQFHKIEDWPFVEKYLYSQYKLNEKILFHCIHFTNNQ